MSYLQKPTNLYIEDQYPVNEVSIDEPNARKVIQQELYTPIGEMIELYKNLPPQIFIYPGVSSQSFGFVFGPTKSGKTTFVESLFLNIAAGCKDFLNKELAFTNKKCLVISLEEAAKPQRIGRNKKQIEGFTDEEKKCIEENYMVSNNYMPAFIYNENHWTKLKDAITNSEADLVAIDSLNRLTGDNNGEEAVAKRITKKLQEFVEQLKITLFVINHTTKSSCKEIQTHSSMRGSGLYSSEADFLIAVNRTQNNSRYSKLVFSRHDSDDDEIVTEFELSKYRLVEYKDSVSEGALLKQEDGRTDDSNEKIILEEMEDIIKDKNINEVETKELSHLFDSAQAKMVKKTFYNAIDKLVFKGNIEKLKKGTYSIK